MTFLGLLGAAAATDASDPALRVDRDGPPGVPDRALHMSVLKELMGQELRDIIRAELKSAIAELLGGSSAPCNERGGEGSVAQTPRPSELSNNVPCLMESQIEQVASKQEVAAEFAGTSTQATGRLSMSSDVPATARYMHEIAMSKRLDAVLAEVQARREAEQLAVIVPSLASTIFSVDHVMSRFGTTEAPCRSDCLSRVADSLLFQLASNFVTVSNCAFLTYVADLEVRSYPAQLPKAVVYIDHAFWAILAIELVVRIWRNRWHYFFEIHYLMNWTDLVIVLGGLVELVTSHAQKLDPQFLRALRMFRLLKVLRVLRVLRMFKTLRVIIESLRSSLTDLFWCTVLIVTIQYMFALFFVMRTGTYLRDNGQAPSELTEDFGSISAAMLNLFTVSMGGGDWAVQFEALLPTGLLNRAMYLFFVVLSFVALLNVILGVFVDRAMKNLELTKEEKAREHAQEEIRLETDLRALCKEGDEDSDGTLTREEWDRLFSKGKMTCYMDVVGFRAHDLRAFFDLCIARTNNGRVDIDAFVRGCMRMKGGSSCFDVQTMIVELHALHQNMKAVNDERHHAALKEYAYIRTQLARLLSRSVDV